MIWNTPILAERRSPKVRPPWSQICCARTRASFVASAIPIAFACALVSGLVGAVLSVTVLPPPKVQTPTRQPSNFDRFLHHLVYWLVVLFLCKILVPNLPEFISPLVVCLISLGCALLTSLLLKRRARRARPIKDRPVAGTRVATAFFWWFAAGFVISMALMIATSDGRG